MKAKTLAGGGLALGLLVMSMVPVAAQAVDDRAGCSATAVPLCANAAQQTLRVTLADDSSNEGTLRWAFEQAEGFDGITEIRVAEGLVIESTGDILIVSGIRLIGEGEKKPTIRAVNDSADGLLVSEWTGDDLDSTYPVHIENIIFDATAPEMAGLQVGLGVSSLGIYDSEFIGFQRSGVTTAPGDDELAEVEVVGSRFADTRESGGGGYYFNNEDSTTAVLVRDSTFENNAGAGFASDAMISGTPDKHSTVVVEDSRFIGNGAGDEPGAALNLWAMRLDEEVPGVQLSEPFVVVRDSLFEGNRGKDAGALLLPELNAEVSGTMTGTLIDISGNTFTTNTNVSGIGGRDVTLPNAFVEDLEAIDGQPKPLCTDLTLLSVSNSTFSNTTGDQPAVSISDVSCGAISFLHDTFVSSGAAFAGPFEDAQVSFTNTAFDTAQEPLSGASAAGLNLQESHVAYTTAPASVAAGDGRVVATSKEFALGELQLAGGAVPVHVPGVIAGSTPERLSVLINAADPSALTHDQRGESRSQAGWIGEAVQADIGAVEAAPRQKPTAPIDPIDPTKPIDPVDPTKPIDPLKPEPVKPGVVKPENLAHTGASTGPTAWLVLGGIVVLASGSLLVARRFLPKKDDANI